MGNAEESVLLTKLAESVEKKLKNKGYILSFDPGESTGIVITCGNRLVEGYTHDYQTVKELIHKLITPAYSWVICEEFITYPVQAGRSGFNKVIPARVIGAIEAVSYHKNIPVVFQTANEGKHFFRDDIMRVVCPWFENLSTRHERDAARHLYTWAYKN